MDRSDFPAVHLLSSFQGWKRTTSWGTWISCEQVPHTAMTSESQKKNPDRDKSKVSPLTSLFPLRRHSSGTGMNFNPCRTLSAASGNMPQHRAVDTWPPGIPASLFHASPLKKKSIVEKHLRMDRGNRCSHSTIKGPWAALGSALLSEIEHLNLFSRFAHMLFFSTAHFAVHLWFSKNKICLRAINTVLFSATPFWIFTCVALRYKHIYNKRMEKKGNGNKGRLGRSLH